MSGASYDRPSGFPLVPPGAEHGADADLDAIGPLRQWKRAAWCTGMLLPTFAAIYYLSFWLRFEGPLGPVGTRWFTTTVGWVVLLKLAVFLAFRVYRSWGRFVTFYDLVALVQASTSRRGTWRPVGLLGLTHATRS